MLLEISERKDSQQSGLTYQQIIKARQLRRLASNDRQAFEAAMADGEMSPDETDEIMDGVVPTPFSRLVTPRREMRSLL